MIGKLIPALSPDELVKLFNEAEIAKGNPPLTSEEEMATREYAALFSDVKWLVLIR